nr:MAG: hypothetical protein DIU70_07785 [Bacillota bacterium]
MADTVQRLAGAALAVTALTVVQKVVGFLTELAVAGAFGASAATDAYLVGLTLPYLVANTAMAGLSLALVPALTGALAGAGAGAALGLARRYLRRLGLGGLIVALLGGAVLPWAVAPVTAGWSPELRRLAVASGWIAWPAVALGAVAAVYQALLHSHRVFYFTPLGIILQNLAVAVPALWLSHLGPLVLAGGYTAGVGLHLLLYLLAWQAVSRRVRGGSRPAGSAQPAGFSPEAQPAPPAGPGAAGPGEAPGQPRALLVPLVAWSLLGQAPTLIERLFAGWVPPGAVSAYYYAYKLRQFPVETAVQAVATVTYPALAAAAALGRRQELGATVAEGVRLGLLGALPAAVGLGVLAEPIVRVVYERGAFGPGATAMTAGALAGYAPGIPAQAVATVLAYTLFATGRPWWPPVALFLAALVQAGTAWLLLPAAGAAALPWASSVAAGAAGAGLALAWARGQGARVPWRQVVAPPFLATLPVAAVSLVAAGPLRRLPPGPGLALGLLGTIGAAVLAFLLALARMRLPEADLLLRKLFRLFPARNRPEG